MHKKTLATIAAGVLGTTVLIGGANATELMGGTSAAADDCRPQRLPEPDWAVASEVSAGSPSGTLLAGSGFDDSHRSRPLIWRNGEVAVPKIDVSQPELAAISSTGLAVGFGLGQGDSEGKVPFAYQDGETWKLPTLNKPGGAAIEAISPDGRTAVGSEAVYKNGKPDHTVPVRWSGKRLQKVQKIAGQADSGALGVDRDTVVGTSGDGAYVWPGDGKHAPLPRAHNTKKPSRAEAVRGEYAVGYAMTRSDERGAVTVLWNIERGTATRLPYAVNDAPDVNSSGVAAISTRDGDGEAAIVENGRILELPSLGGAASAFTISDDGVVAGLARNADDEAHAVVWRGCGS